MDVDRLLKFLGLIVMKCPFCGNKIITSCTFGSGAYHCDKCSSYEEMIKFDYVSEETLRKNQEEHRDMLVEYLKEHYSSYLD